MAGKTTGRSSAGAAAGVLGQLASMIPSKAAPKPGKALKWEMSLTPEAAEMADRWIKAKVVSEPVLARQENAKTEFCEYAVRVMAEKLFANKSKPSNPLVVTKKDDGKTNDHQFQFTMTDKFKYRFPPVPEGTDPRDHFVRVFQDLGLNSLKAEELVDNELDFNPIMGLKTLTELMEGSYGEGREWVEASDEMKAAGNKLAALLMWQGDTDNLPEALTLEEKSLVINRSPGMQVKAGFYDRVATYAQSVDQLMQIFSVIQPIAYPVYPKFALNDTATDRTRRLIEAAAEILGTATDSAEDE